MSCVRNPNPSNINPWHRRHHRCQQCSWSIPRGLSHHRWGLALWYPPCCSTTRASTRVELDPAFATFQPPHFEHGTRPVPSLLKSKSRLEPKCTCENTHVPIRGRTHANNSFSHGKNAKTTQQTGTLLNCSPRSTLGLKSSQVKSLVVTYNPAKIRRNFICVATPSSLPFWVLWLLLSKANTVRLI